jgi:hypothetical protein
MRILLRFVASALLLVLFLYGAWEHFEKRTQDRVLAIIASAQPGRPISEVINQFGKPGFFTDEVERMRNGGAPVDPVFCNGKTLHQYYATPPCTWVNIYTDKQGIIVFVNWSRS